MHTDRVSPPASKLRAGLLATALATGCGQVEVVETNLPPQTGAKTLLLAVERRSEASAEVQGFDLALTPEPSFALDGLDTEEELQLGAVFYAETLSELGLEVGSQATSSEFCFHVAAIDRRAPLASFRRTIGPEGATPLESTTELQTTLAAARLLPSADACLAFEETFDRELIKLDATQDSTFASRLFDGSVLVGTQAVTIGPHRGTIWLLTDRGASTQVERVDLLDANGEPLRLPAGHEPTWTGFQAPDGAIILSDAVNAWLQIAEFRREASGPKLVISSTRAYAPSDQDRPETGESLRGRYKWLQKSGPGEPGEIFALSWEGHFERWVPGQPPELIHDFGDFTGILSHAALIRLGPGEAMAGFNSSPFIVHYANGSVRMELVAEGAGISALAVHPSGPVYAANANSAIYTRTEGGEWRLDRDLQLGAPISTLVPWRGGLLVSGTGGFFGRLATLPDDRERFLLCRQTLRHSVRLHALLGEGAVVFTGSPIPGELNPVVEVLRPKAEQERFAPCYHDPDAP